MAKKGERVGAMGDSVYYRTPEGQIIDDQGNVIKGPMAKMMADEYESKQQEKAKAQAEAKAAAARADEYFTLIKSQILDKMGFAKSGVYQGRIVLVRTAKGQGLPYLLEKR